jgi:signal transduction histidine kinase
MKKIIYLSLFLLLPPVLSAQTNVDSLVNVLNSQKQIPSEQLRLYYRIVNSYVSYDLEKASGYAQKGLALAEKENDKSMASKFNAVFGRIYGTKSSYDTAFVYLEKALALATEAGDKEQEAVACLGIGNLYARSNKRASALEYFTKALSICESLGEKQRCIAIMTNIASLYRETDNDERVIYYLEKAKKLSEEMNDATGKMQVYFELGAIYHKMAGTNNDREKTNQALDYELKAHEISINLQSKIHQAATADALSAIYSDLLKDYDMSLKYAEESLKIAEETGDMFMVSASWVAISNACRAQGRYKDSEEAALKALETDSTNVYRGSNIMENILFANIMLGNKNKATLFLGNYIDVNNKRIDQSNREMMADMEVKYETEKKEMRIATLEKDRKLYTSLGIVTIMALLSGMGFLFYRHRSKRKLAEQQIRQLEQEKELIAVRSALDAEKAEREIIARDLHDGVGAMLSVVKNNMNVMKSYSVIENKEVDYFNKALDGLDKSIVELRRVAHHIMPAILMEKGLAAALDDFCRSIPEAEFHCPESGRRFDPERELVLYRCAYELVNNALRHAKASRTEVHLNTDEEMAYLSVVDNGCGFDPQTVPQGMGIKNMRSRLAVFGGSIEIYSEPGKGTEANAELKI